MAKNSTIAISYQIIDEGNGLKKLAMDAESFKKVVRAAVKESSKLEKSIYRTAAWSTSIDAANNAMASLQGTLKGLTDAYAKQVEAETKLAVNMRNTMGAREADIQSIKDLFSFH